MRRAAQGLHQTWVDTSGMLLTLEGGRRDGKMVLEGQTTGVDGVFTRHPITWTPNADGTVRGLPVSQRQRD